MQSTYQMSIYNILQIKCLCNSTQRVKASERRVENYPPLIATSSWDKNTFTLGNVHQLLIIFCIGPLISRVTVICFGFDFWVLWIIDRNWLLDKLDRTCKPKPKRAYCWLPTLIKTLFIELVLRYCIVWASSPKREILPIWHTPWPSKYPMFHLNVNCGDIENYIQSIFPIKYSSI